MTVDAASQAVKPHRIPSKTLVGVVLVLLFGVVGGVAYGQTQRRTVVADDERGEVAAAVEANRAAAVDTDHGETALSDDELTSVLASYYADDQLVGDWNGDIRGTIPRDSMYPPEGSEPGLTAVVDADGDTTGYWVDRYGFVEKADAEAVDLDWERVMCEVIDIAPVSAPSRGSFAADAGYPGLCG